MGLGFDYRRVVKRLPLGHFRQMQGQGRDKFTFTNSMEHHHGHTQVGESNIVGPNIGYRFGVSVALI
jgi:hypothetical protein